MPRPHGSIPPTRSPERSTGELARGRRPSLTERRQATLPLRHQPPDRGLTRLGGAVLAASRCRRPEDRSQAASHPLDRLHAVLASAPFPALEQRHGFLDVPPDRSRERGADRVVTAQRGDEELPQIADRAGYIGGRANTRIADAVAVAVQRQGLGDGRTVVAGIADAVAVRVGLVRVRDRQAVVAVVADAVTVAIGLRRAIDKRTVVMLVRDAVTILVAGSGRGHRDRRALVIDPPEGNLVAERYRRRDLEIEGDTVEEVGERAAGGPSEGHRADRGRDRERLADRDREGRGQGRGDDDGEAVAPAPAGLERAELADPAPRSARGEASAPARDGLVEHDRSREDLDGPPAPLDTHGHRHRRR